MKKKILLALLALCVTAAPIMSQHEAPSKLNGALYEAVTSQVNDDNLDLQFNVIDYRIIDNHIANIGVAMSVGLPEVNLDMEMSVRNAALGDRSGPLFVNADETAVIALLTRASPKADALEKMPINPMTQEEWAEAEALLFASAATMEQDSGFKLTATPTHTLEDGRIDAFNIVMTPVTETAKAAMKGELTITVTLYSDHVEALCIVTDPTGEYVVFDEQEQAAMEFIAKLEVRDPAAMAMTQAVGQMAKGYTGMVAAMPAMLQPGSLPQAS